jgi:hypothetical protein
MTIFKNKHYYSFLLGFNYVQIDFYLFQEAITFKTPKSSLENCNLSYFLNIFKSYLIQVSLLLRCYDLLERFEYHSIDTNKKFPTNVF